MIGYTMGTPRVIYSIATRIGTPGLGTVSYHALRALLDEDMLVRAVTYGNGSDLPRAKVRALPGNPAKLLFFLPREVYRPMRKGFLDYVASRAVRREGCDVFHGWNNQAIRSIRAAHGRGARAVLDCGSTYRPYRDELLREEYARFGARMKEPPGSARESSLAELREADHIFLPSEFARKTFVAGGFDPARLHVIPRAADAERFRPSDAPSNRFSVLFVGRLSLRKGVQYLLEAWKTLGLRDAELVLAGGVDETFAPLLARYRDLPGLVLAGHMKDVAPAYRAASVFVLPSIEEGSAKATYEAMASGLPVVTTENSGSPVRDGIDGHIVPIRDPGAIASRILALRDDPDSARAMGLRGRERVLAYTWENYRMRFIETYRRLFAA
jgi:glycosyltransferase involved in cell wall biosynthesis